MATLTIVCGKSFVNAAKSELKAFDTSSEIRTRDFRISSRAVLYYLNTLEFSLSCKVNPKPLRME